MTDLTILRAKPNPFGKDRTRSYAPNSQLVGEWVDIKNTSGKNLNMENVKIYDHTFTNTCGDEGKRLIFSFGSYVMPTGIIIRIHSGNKIPDSQLAPQDLNGADVHAYTGYSYVWNNVCGDTAEIRNSDNLLIDETSYGSYPMEGRILLRQGQYLL